MSDGAHKQTFLRLAREKGGTRLASREEGVARIHAQSAAPGRGMAAVAAGREHGPHAGLEKRRGCILLRGRCGRGEYEQPEQLARQRQSGNPICLELSLSRAPVNDPPLTL